MRLATWNVAWFDRLFDDEGQPQSDNARSARHGITRAEQLEAIAFVMHALDADGIMVIEAPDSGGRRGGARALQNFAAEAGLRVRDALIGFPSHTQQEIAFLYDRDVMSVRHDPRGGPGQGPRFDADFVPFAPATALPQRVVWSKPPLELDVRVGGHRLRLIGVHAKSKAPRGADSAADLHRIAVDNRRKQLAQCQWLRVRVDAHLDAGDSLIVMGDFNDGPGLDEEEQLFGESGVEIVMGHGAPADRQLVDPNARLALAGKLGAQPATARFAVPPDWRILSALLDYVMVSPDLCAREPQWRIWHPFDDPAIYAAPELREALLLASDHFPVTIDLDLATGKSAAPH